MALIPPDVGLRMRMQAETSLLQPTAPVQEIPSELTELRAGQTFTARIQEALPENTYRALVAGKQMTLQLPEGVKTGDTLELVVIDRTPKVVIARLAEAEAGKAAAEPYPYAKLSNAAQMIGQLLLPEGETPEPAALNRGQPLLAQPPASAAELAPVLQKAVTQSGLFYEAHQAQWVAGRFPTERLLQEPQGQRSAPEALERHGLPPPVPGRAIAQTAASFANLLPPVVGQAMPGTAPQGGAPPGVPGESEAHVPGTTLLEQRMVSAVEPQTAGRAAATPDATAQLQRMSGEAGRHEATAAAQGPAGVAANVSAVPDELRSLVQQQLDAAATQRLVWHGEVWPNQAMDWEIVREDERGAQSGVEDEPAWRTRLALETPRLGRVDASLRLTAEGLQLALAAPGEAAAADLRDAMPSLSASLDAAGITLLSFLVKHEPA